MIVSILAILGLIISIYAIFVERKNAKKPYKAACDISEKISCTKAFSSKYGKIIGISNSIIGIFFYIIIILLSLDTQTKIIFYFLIPAMLGTIYLAYISYIKMKNFCLVCTAIYVINTLIFVFSYFK